MSAGIYDVIIVGGGPSGLTAALYTARRSLHTLVVSKDIGGQAATTTLIENYPGVGAIDGYELMQKFKEQAMQYGAEFVLGDVEAITKTESGNFLVQYNAETVETQAVILAFGLTPRSLGAPGERELTGKGVFYSVAAAVDQLHDKTVAVLGGGNSAIESVNTLAGIAKHVYLVHRRDRFRAEAVLIDQLNQHKNVTQVLNAEVTQIQGTDHVTGVTVHTIPGDTTQDIAVDAVCVNIGFMSKTSFVESLVKLNDKREIIIKDGGDTGMPGIFAAGDITTSNYKQVVVSAGEGCKAALTCFTYLMTKQGKTISVDQDWQVKTGQKHFIRT